MESCCTCTTVLSSTPPYTKAADAVPQDRRLNCCARIICGKCILGNQRFADYCPYCQISSTPSPLPQRLRDPPAYSSMPSSTSRTAELSDTPPPYIPDPEATTTKKAAPDVDDEKAAAQDILHFIDHKHDSVTSLSLRYRVPIAVFRRTNNLTSDHLLAGRRTVLIPGEYCKGGVSLSPRPIEGEEEELRKGKIRRFMTSCKVSDYDIAVLYLEQAGYDVGAAVEQYMDDELWEAENPPDHRGKGSRLGRERKTRGPFWRGL
ncbi:hypothetical protein B0J13DRAFT_10930 [Dactylonectria estremocensis]|uniref:LysM domain-containing protein n=1 Tax=Dactylonectria estremocensis TaxID=1079267 RepID=A0A9P9FK61_9HYPO|nr:hypothetical protein B0J13DRAFT_10930 [Dactylonectria estremocensis]